MMSLIRGPFSRRYNKVCGRQNGFQPTTMPHPRFPVELLDYIVDHLHDVRDALESCCLVSTSWIPRTRRHLFAKVAFRSENDLQSWKNVFPEPSTSPACYTDHLVIYCPEGVTPADAEGRGWIPTFSRVVRFDMDFDGPEISLLPFYGFSPSLRSLQICYSSFPFPRILNLIHSFPLIDDLSLISGGDDPIEDIDGPHAAVQPPLTGCLELYARDGMDYLVSRLFPTQNDLYFRKLDLESADEVDILVVSALVERCRFTLESFKVDIGHYRMSV